MQVYTETKDKDGSKDNKVLCSAKLWKQSMHCLPSDPNVRKEWMTFIFNEVPDRVSKNLVLCSLHFTVDSFTNNAQFEAGFSERLKIKDNAVPAILDTTVMSHQTRYLKWLFHCIVVKSPFWPFIFKCMLKYTGNYSNQHRVVYFQSACYKCCRILRFIYFQAKLIQSYCKLLWN